MVVLALAAVLLGILLPVIGRAREAGRRTRCAANLAGIGKAFAAYASEHKGFVPRGATYAQPRFPLWVAVLQPYLRGRAADNWSDISATPALQCPSHPTPGIPTAFVVNAFAFETAPAWRQSAATAVGGIRNPANLPFVLETPDQFKKRSYVVFDDIFFEIFHVIHDPAHLPGSPEPRVSFVRHGRMSNVLYLDGHVDVVRPGGLALDDFDDGLRNR